VTSIDKPAGVVDRALRTLFALLDDCWAIISLRSGAWPLQEFSRGEIDQIDRAAPDARRSAADNVTGKRSTSCRLKSLRSYFLLIWQGKAQEGGCRTAKTAERS
jgi:hypothetical protein